MDARKYYFEELLCNDEIKKYVSLINNESECAGELIIEFEDIKKVIKMLKSGKDAGHDQVTGDMLKNVGLNEL